MKRRKLDQWSETSNEVHDSTLSPFGGTPMQLQQIALYRAINMKVEVDVEKIKQLLKNKAIQTSENTRSRLTNALERTCKEGNLNKVNRLLEISFLKNCVKTNSHYLSVALEYRHLDVAASLVKHGADLSSCSAQDQQDLRSVIEGQESVLGLLMILRPFTIEEPEAGSNQVKKQKISL